MKKKITILLSVLAMTIGYNVSAQAVSEGNIIIDPYYGYPNFGKTFANGIAPSDLDGAKITGIGPAGLRAEYMIADNFGIGVDFIYNSTNLVGTIDSLNNDGTVHSTYDGKLFTQRYRVHLRMNYHFVQTDALDAYVGFGLGTNTRRIGFNTEYPNYDGFSATGALIPISGRLALGMRYYFTENIGANVELGIGGPVMSGGLSLKF